VELGGLQPGVGIPVEGDAGGGGVDGPVDDRGRALILFAGRGLPHVCCCRWWGGSDRGHGKIYWKGFIRSLFGRSVGRT